jgi:hypothetical protein
VDRGTRGNGSTHTSLKGENSSDQRAGLKMRRDVRLGLLLLACITVGWQQYRADEDWIEATKAGKYGGLRLPHHLSAVFLQASSRPSQSFIDGPL